MCGILKKSKESGIVPKGERESGATPERTRHCKRERPYKRHWSDLRRRMEAVISSQETCFAAWEQNVAAVFGAFSIGGRLRLLLESAFWQPEGLPFFLL